MRTFFLILAVSGLALAQTAARPARPRPEVYNEQWVSLFNGKDLAGWESVGGEKWTVENGVIHGVGVTKGYGYLQTAKKYKDFDLAIRFKCESDGNSGVFVHTAFKPGTADVSQGMQFEIDRVANHHTGGLYGDGRGWIAWPSPEYEFVLRPNDWNEYLLKVDGNRYVARLNGVLIIDFTDPTPASFDGTIALQLHAGGQGDMRFKDIYIRDFSRR
jgi:hypothetical protein